MPRFEPAGFQTVSESARLDARGRGHLLPKPSSLRPVGVSAHPAGGKVGPGGALDKRARARNGIVSKLGWSAEERGRTYAGTSEVASATDVVGTTTLRRRVHPGARECERRSHTGRVRRPGDRKSTRLNSSHVAISYAVFC